MAGFVRLRRFRHEFNPFTNQTPDEKADLSGLAQLLDAVDRPAVSTTARIPTLNRREMLLKEYGEVGSTFRMLTDIRFKLLAFIPLAAGAAGAVLARIGPGPITFAFFLFGLVVTLGLATYNARNDQLYDTLVGRAAALERMLGDPDGAFANRPQPWLRVALGGGLKWEVNHRTAVAAIYYASIGLWVFGVVDVVAQLAYDLIAGGPSPRWLGLGAVGFAAVVTILGAFAVARRKHRRERELRRLARDAVMSVEAMWAKGWDVAVRARDDGIQTLSRLADEDPELIKTRIRFIARLPPSDLTFFLGSASGVQAAAQMVAYLTDFPPEWLYDCATSRRRALA
ncbi:hypothetical protein [Pseudonocardia sp.]|uniref:hypothetical protein n=1 Tax=Pseudonocardia sp. TaxID=60912 RepID=UPI00260CBB0D|nr:hypothetical protein [Pseudonocardia sp.]